MLDKNGTMICFDPSTKYQTDSCLLIKKRELFEALKENNLTIIWKVNGEKIVKSMPGMREEGQQILNINRLIFLEKDKYSFKDNSYFEDYL